MGVYRFTAAASVTLVIDAPSEELARAQIFSDLQDADTDFIRSDHFDDRSIRAEFHLTDIAPQPEPTP